jgi:hypothetical protein
MGDCFRSLHNQPEQTDALVDMFQTNDEMQMAICIRCGEFFPDARKQLGLDKCMPCNTIYAKARGDQIKQQSAPINKSNYMYISNIDYLKQLNPKRTT